MTNRQDIKITNEALSIISELDEFKAHWKLLDKMTPEKLTNLKKVATIERVGSSNRIETVKKAVSNLVNKNYLILHSKGRGAWYSKQFAVVQ